MSEWSVQDSKNTYRIPRWAEGYFDIDEDGQVLMTARGCVPIRLSDLPGVLSADMGPPVLVRFLNILDHRLDAMHRAFQEATARYDFDGTYLPIYPIKVNQQRMVVERLAGAGRERIGLEAGSKAELVAVMAMSEAGGTIICNGYKDAEYIRLAMTGIRMGLKIYVVIEKPSELEQVIRQSRALGVEPLLGVRVRLASIGAGKWQNTGGERSKFGLSATQILAMVDRLQAVGLTASLQLLHFHMGSQISGLEDIRRGLHEAGRYFVELCQRGLPISIVDVGGGLGVDYEGAQQTGYCSMNYRLGEYADTVVSELASVCAEEGLQAPSILTEAGRAMTAHHAVLLTNVVDVEQAPDSLPEHGAHPRVQAFKELADDAGLTEADCYQRAAALLAGVHQDYALGRIDLDVRSSAELAWYGVLACLQRRLEDGPEEQADLLDEINLRLSDKLFCNFSLFQSLPDIWAFNQIFPIMPLQRLNERPARRAVLYDLTCDSDGQIQCYVDTAGIEHSLPVHQVRADEEYLIGVFMVGAYQEILGDLHNLFGDTHVINIDSSEQGFEIISPEQGDRVDQLLEYIHYDIELLSRKLFEKCDHLPGTERDQIISLLEEGITGYTYHED
jgi:arginine decarboxylase